MKKDGGRGSVLALKTTNPMLKTPKGIILKEPSFRAIGA
jgi:hypothetical protein